MAGNTAFQEARRFLLDQRRDYAAARAGFRWPRLDEFNWALDWFDEFARGNTSLALWALDERGREEKRSFAEIASRSDRMANFLRGRGVARGDRVLLMLANLPELWEVLLACIKLGVVVVPTTVLAGPAEIQDRVERGKVDHVVAGSEQARRFPSGLLPSGMRMAVGEAVAGWLDGAQAEQAPTDFQPDGPTRASDPVLLYFTSGTTAKPKLVLHTHESYPVGHLSTIYWLGLQPGDLHLNVSSPGWAKHAWSSFFAPWTAGAAVFVHQYERFTARGLLEVLSEKGITTLCAPPTVWRMLIQEDLERYPLRLREAVSAGEPLNPRVIDAVEKAWNVTVRDGYGQTETTALVGNSPGQRVKPGFMGRPLPGYEVVLLDRKGAPASEGELAVRLSPRRPVGLMAGYVGDDGNPQESDREYYRTGDVAERDEQGSLRFVGRDDDVFKSSDYRISPFELESVLIRHPAVAEAAVVPAPHPTRLSVPKAFLTLVAAKRGDRLLALDILRFARRNLAPYKRIRRLEFAELPKTISGKIRRVDLRGRESGRESPGERRRGEYWEEDFPELHK